MRKDKLVTGEVYHVFNKSIAGFKIFNSKFEFLRARDTIHYYQVQKPETKFSKFIRRECQSSDYFCPRIQIPEKKKMISIIAYCIMPTHIHLILKQLTERGISIFMNRALDSYARYFNNKYRRKGPLWQGRFENVLVKNDEQLLHLTRYVHLNPVTAHLVDKPEEWEYSSYLQYLRKSGGENMLCKYDGILDIDPALYREFVEDRISYQRELAKIKELIIE